MKTTQRIHPLRILLILAATLILMLCLTVRAGAVHNWDSPWEEYGAAETGLTLFSTKKEVDLGWTREIVDLYGLKDSAGNIVLPAKYGHIAYANRNRLIVGDQDSPFRSNDWVIDLKGNVLYPKAKESQSLYYFKDVDVFVLSKGGRECLLNTNFQRLSDKSYYNISYYGRGFFECSNSSDQGVNCTYGLYKLGAGLLLPVRYDRIGVIDWKAENWLFTAKNQNFLLGIYDENGKQVLSESYSLIEGCQNGYLIAAKYRKPEYARDYNNKFREQDGKLINAFGLLDMEENVILPFEYDAMSFTENGDIEASIWDGTTTTSTGPFGETRTTYYYDTTTISLADLMKNQPKLVDVPSSAWCFDAVQWAADKGMIDGTARYLKPNEKATRGEVVKYLWKAAGSPEPAGSNPFTDISEGDSYYKAALWAYEQGITTGSSATTFAPKSTCTRAQVVTFLWRSMDGGKADGQSKFTDVSATAYYADSVAWAVKRNITTGTTTTTFSPDATCTRAQILTFLYRAYQ